MKLYVGLGNPGKEYEGTRHNMGFWVLDKFADKAGVSFDRHDFKGSYAVVKNPVFSETIYLLKPETYMNLSGTSVRPFMDYFHLTPADIVVVSDDMALPEGAIRLRPNGSSGSHKGVQNIIDQLHTQEFKRVRVGIGEPPREGAVDFVLGKPKGESYDLLDEATTRAAEALRAIALDPNFSKVMSQYNTPKKEGKDHTTL